jgi:PAS domain S-box-containing protein
MIRFLPGLRFFRFQTLAALTACVFVIGLFAACSPTPSGQFPPAFESIRVVMDDNYPPYTFRDNNGKLMGILIDQWQLWEKKTGIKVEISAIDWGKAQDQMKEGKFDVIDTIFFNESRAKIYDFSKPYARLDVPIFFPLGLSGISDAGSLKGFPVAVKKGDAAIEVLRAKGVDQLVEYNSYEAIIQAAKDHKVNFFVVDQPPALYFLYKLGIQDQFNYTPPLYSGEFHRAVHKGNTGLLQMVERGFASISKEEYNAIDLKWMGQGPVSPEFWRMIAIIGGGGLLFVLMLSGWNYTLRRQVASRTIALKSAMVELASSEQKYRQLVFNLPGVVYRCANDENWTVLYISDAIFDIFGYPPTYFLDQPQHGLLSIFLPTNAKSTLAMIREKTAQGGKFMLNYRVTAADGTIFWVSNRGQVVVDEKGAVQWIDGVMFDITERKLAEQSLHVREEDARRFSAQMAALTRVSMELAQVPNSDELFRKAVELGIGRLGFDRMGIWVVDETDPNYLRGTFGVDESGKLRDERHRRYSLDQTTLIHQLVQGKVPLVYQKDYELCNDVSQVVGIGEQVVAALWDGQIINGYITVDNLLNRQPFDSQKREILLLYAQVVGHLNGLKKSEAALRQLNAELEQRVLQRTAQLEASYREMQSFSYSISHDLRAPLRTLNSFSQILQEDYGEHLDAQGHDYLNRIQSASLHMTELIDALLKLARVSRSDLQVFEVNLSSIAQNIASGLQTTQPERSVVWIIPNGLICNADPILIRVLLENLLGNAWKFTSQHSTARIELGSIPQEGKLVFFVRDDGAGFDMAYANKLFGAFQRLHLASEFEGTGIGLAIVQRIIHRHGGEIWAESMPEQGATFYFTL